MTDVAKEPSRNRRRRSQRTRTASPAPIIQRSNISSYQLLDDNALRTIEKHADWILETVGIEFQADTIALDLFSAQGATVEGERITFEPGLVRHLCSTAPETFSLHSRDPRHTVTLGGDHIVLMPGYDSPFVTDLEKGRRYATLEDFENLVKLTYMPPSLHHSGGTVCEPTDIQSTNDISTCCSLIYN